MHGHPGPLVARAATDVVAWHAGAARTAAELTAAAARLAATLPGTGPVINHCDDRYGFLVALVAAIQARRTLVLPPSPAALGRLVAGWPDCVVVGDRGPPPGSDAARFVAVDATAGPPVPAPPEPEPGHLALVTYTGGSTGEPLPQRKTWAMLRDATAVNLAHYLPPGPGPVSVVATVPSQHLYGLETTALAALRGPVAIGAGMPLYPADVAAALAAVPAPRLLVSTPVHLRALLASGQPLPPLARVLSATAPLAAPLAAAVERQLGCELVEIYGCSEAGSLAARRAAQDEPWRFFPGYGLQSGADGPRLHAPHLPQPVRVPDRLEFAPDGRFRIAGRDSDLVKVAGKRGSLGEITAHLLALPGVVDAVVLPGPADGRLAALVVAPGRAGAELAAGLRARIDPALVPRPILVVDALPRAASGKLPRADVEALYARLTGRPVPPA